MYCRSCGNKMEEGAKFCSKCGANNSLEGTNTNNNQSNQKKKKSVFKQWLKLVAVLYLLYSISVIIEVMLKMKGINVDLMTFMNLITIYGIMFGWIGILLYDGIKGYF